MAKIWRTGNFDRTSSVYILALSDVLAKICAETSVATNSHSNKNQKSQLASAVVAGKSAEYFTTFPLELRDSDSDEKVELDPNLQLFSLHI